VTEPRPVALVAPHRLPRTVIALGWVSLLTDAASDLIYPLIPAFLLTLGGGPQAIGWLEGIAEAVGAALKLTSGALSDRFGRRKPFIALGYGVSALTRPLLALATSPFHAVLVRALDRVGKGLRGPPRDAMVADATPPEMRGHAFGFHRMMDNSGAVIGALLGFLCLSTLHLEYRTIFTIAVVPGLLAVLVALAFVREAKAPPRVVASPGAGAPRVPLGPAARRYFVAIAVFSLAGSGDLFLVYRLIDLGLPKPLVPIAWMSLQLGKALLNVPGGKAADRYGRRRVLVLAWILYAISYAAFGLAPGWAIGWAVLAVYALHYGLAEGGQKALLAECVPATSFGRAYGMLLALEGLMVLPANIAFGFAYAKVGPAVAFGAAGVAALVGALVLATVRPARAAG
jgi:MFS family permease